jgi:hypothetical protein
MPSDSFFLYFFLFILFYFYYYYYFFIIIIIFMWCNVHDGSEMNIHSFCQNLKRKGHLNYVHMNWNSLTGWLASVKIVMILQDL